MSEKIQAKNREIHVLSLQLLAKMQEAHARLLAKQKTLTASRNTSIRNWERQNETVLKLLQTTISAEKLVYSDGTIEKQNEILKIQEEKDKLRRFNSDQNLIIKNQKNYLENSQAENAQQVSYFYSKKSQKSKNSLVFLPKLIQKEEEKLQKLKQDLESTSDELENTISEIQRYEEKLREETEKNKTLKQTKQQKILLLNQENQKKFEQALQHSSSNTQNLENKSKEQLIQIKNEKIISCLGFEELVKKNSQLKQQLNEIKKQNSDEAIKSQENPTKVHFSDQQEEKQKLVDEIEALKTEIEKIDSKFLTLKDSIQGFSQIPSIDSFFKSTLFI